MRNDDLPLSGALHSRVRHGRVAVLLASAALLAGPGAARAQVDVERFDGSFRLETGEVLTGGYMVEGEGFWIYMDVEGLDRGGAFRPGATPSTFVSFAPLSAYAYFLEAWEDAEPPLQALVEETRKRIEALARERG